MLCRQITRFWNLNNPTLSTPLFIQHSQAHLPDCPVTKANQKRCPGAGGLKQGGPCCKVPAGAGGSSTDGGANDGRRLLKRALMPGKVRMGFIPEEWFGFLKPMTGVSGPYILMLGLTNYLVSKEIFVMEHEYYMGISQFIMVYFVTTRFGPHLSVYLDKEVDKFASELEKTRTDELAFYNRVIKDSETAIWRANGQKDLIQAKKENIAIQLEAIYRERAMMVYQRVRNRLNYHVKRHRTEQRVKQTWMVLWVLENVEKSFTTEFKKQAMENAILILTALAERKPYKSQK